jgi:hypothetical protein
MDGSVNQHRIAIPVFEPGYRGFPPVGRPVVGDPEDTARGSIGRLRHDEIDQLMKARNACSFTAKAEDFGAANIPCRQVRQRPFPLVPMLDTARAPRLGCGRWSHTPPGLDAGLLVGADDVIARSQGFALPVPVVEIEHQTGLAFEIRIPRSNPTAITPGADGIGVEPAPSRGPADRRDNAPLDSFLCDLLAAEPGEVQPQVLGQLKGKGLDLHDDLRGKSAGPPAPWPFLKSGQAFLEKAFSPLRDDLPGQVEALSDLLVGEAFGGEEDDLDAFKFLQLFVPKLLFFLTPV